MAVVTTPQPAPSAVITAFDEAAATYDNVGVDFFTPIGQALVDHAAIRPGEHVLDVGCGRGAVLLPAAAAAGPGGRAVGIDLAPAMVALTAAAAAEAGLRTVEVTVGDAQDPAFPAGSFDVITAGLVLFFLPDAPAALRAYGRLLRTGGRLAFSSFTRNDPHFQAAMQALARHAPGAGPRPATPDLFAAPEAARSVLTANGYRDADFREIEVRSVFRDPAHWLRWAWSHGARQLLRTIPEAGLPAAAADAAEALRGARTGNGDELALITTARTVTAVHPG